MWRQVFKVVSYGFLFNTSNVIIKNAEFLEVLGFLHMYAVRLQLACVIEDAKAQIVL